MSEPQPKPPLPDEVEKLLACTAMPGHRESKIVTPES
jgi:hypothetical protein